MFQSHADPPEMVFGSTPSPTSGRVVGWGRTKVGPHNGELEVLAPPGQALSPVEREETSRSARLLAQGEGTHSATDRPASAVTPPRETLPGTVRSGTARWGVAIEGN